MIEVPNEEMNKLFNGICEIINKQRKEKEIKCGNGTNRENPNWRKYENEQFKKSNKNLRGKPHKENVRDEEVS